jgi:hypothetical protein
MEPPSAHAPPALVESVSVQVRFCPRPVFLPYGDLRYTRRYRGVRGTVGLGDRFTVQADPATRPKQGVVRFYCNQKGL